MGSGSSRTKVEKFDKSNQMPSPSEVAPGSKRTTSPMQIRTNDSLFVRPQKSSQQRQRPHIQDDVFELDNNIEEYSTIWDHENKLSSRFQKSLKSNINNIEHHQTETYNNKWNKKSSTNIDSTHIESTIDTETYSSINISSSDKIDEHINNLNKVHTQLDNIIKHRTEQISIETESLLSHIRNETQLKQHRLLNYAKDQQIKQEENYQNLLQEYITHLDQIKAKELDDIQKQLQIYREQILEESQLKIMTVNEQANIIKARILQQEQQQAAEKIDFIIHQIQNIATDEKLQHLGSEIRTKTNIITNANVGTKPSGQALTFDSNQNNQRPRSNKGNSIKKT